MFKLFILIVPFLLFKSFFTLHFFCHLAFSPCISPFEGDNIPLRFRSSPPLKGGWGDVLLRSVICHSERSFCYFWLDPKVTKKSRLRAFHTPSRHLQVGKSGNSLRFRQPDFLSPCSLLRRLTARGPLTNTEAFEARFLTAFGMTKGHPNSYSFRLSALRRGGCPVFFPTLRFAAHWAELIRPFRALTTVSKQINN